MRVSFEIPGSFPSVANLREHWSARAKRAKRHRLEAGLATQAALMFGGRCGQVAEFGGTVTLTRHAPPPLDSDNLASALKATRDGIAAALGVDDGDPRVTWQYAQERCQGGQQRVVAVVEAAREVSRV